MTAHYARLHDTTIRRHWENARKVNVKGETVTIDPDGPLAEANWAKQRLGRATQALPNGYCGLPVQRTCPHANACLACPMFTTTAQVSMWGNESRTVTALSCGPAGREGEEALKKDSIDRYRMADIPDPLAVTTLSSPGRLVPVVAAGRIRGTEGATPRVGGRGRWGWKTRRDIWTITVPM
jgi:hypothetical protein